MEGKYDILRDGAYAGSAEVEKRGLYYHFAARCNIRDGEHIHLKVSCGKKVTDLGLCVPMGDEFGVETSIPVKRFESGTPEFFLGERKMTSVPKEEPKELPEEEPPVQEELPESIRVPVMPDQPFDHLAELENAVLEEQDGVMQIVLTPKAPDPQDSDPTPSPDSE